MGPGPGCLRVPSEAQQYVAQGPLGVQAHRSQPGIARPAQVPYGPREKDERVRGCEDHSPLPHVAIGTGQVSPVLGRWDPPAVRTTFNGSSEKVALFIGQVLNHIDRYGHLYTSQWDWIMAVMTVMEEEAADWVADLYGEHAEELGLFLATLQERFEDTTRTQQVEGELLAVGC